MARRIITLLTDFGLSDHYAGVMKGVILRINPEVDLVDISHDVRPFDILEAALALAQAYQYFPPHTIHLIVVDPGVGSSRRPLLASAGTHTFVAPDNGVLSLVLAREPEAVVRHISSSHYFLEPVSQTFHGRDVFAPVAAWLSRSVEPEKFGEPVSDFFHFSVPQPKRVNERLLKGVVLRVDRFGSLMTNLTPADVPELFAPNPGACKIVIGKAEITRLQTAYAQAAPGEIFAILGSSGYLEISANRASAAQALGCGKGA